VQAWTAKFSPDSKHIATGSSSGNVNVYDVESGEKVQSLEGRGKFSMCVAYVRPVGFFFAFRLELRISTLSMDTLSNPDPLPSFAIDNRAPTENMLPVEPKHLPTPRQCCCSTLPPESSAQHLKVKTCHQRHCHQRALWEKVLSCGLPIFTYYGVPFTSCRTCPDSAIDCFLA
jgi:hypothetical protein